MRYQVPEHICLRKSTVDSDIWTEVVEANVYRLPYVFTVGDEVLDLGAHTGSFSWRCAYSGANVTSVEASRDNYPLLLHNLQPVWDKILPINAAVWRSDVNMTTVPFQKNWCQMNTGGGCTMGDAGTVGYPVVAVPLDDMLRLREKWRLVKLDIEGAEFPVLLTAKELGRVSEIAGEYHHRHETLPFADVGRPCHIDVLRAHLAGQGFAVEVESNGEGMGLFWAKRP